MSEVDLKVGKEEVRATFVETPVSRIGGDTTKVIKSALKKQSVLKAPSAQLSGSKGGAESTIVSSPLLSSTPSTVSKSLVKIYPYLVLADTFLSMLTWTNENIWTSILAVLIYTFTVLHFQVITRYFGHMVTVCLLWSYSLLDETISERMIAKPSLDDIVHTMDRVTKKFDLLFSPITILSAQDVKRLLFTTIFLSPLYISVTVFILSTKHLLLLGGLYVLTYQSPWAKITRRILWKFKFVRLIVFYVTGLDLGGINKHQGILDAVHNQVKKLSNSSTNSMKLNDTVYDSNGNKKYMKDLYAQNGDSSVLSSLSDSDKPIRFTYVLYENQRRWIGIGWTSSMLSYERTPWTDEFLNQAPSPEEFKLPEEDSSLKWKWIDKSWRLDMTNDGAIQLSSTKARTTASPNADAGFIYYDNTWKKPSTQDSFSKYTRRRRWVRTAELIKTHSDDLVSKSKELLNSNTQENAENTSNNGEKSKKPRNVTINEEPIILGEDNQVSQTTKPQETDETEKLGDKSVDSNSTEDSVTTLPPIETIISNHSTEQNTKENINESHPTNNAIEKNNESKKHI